MQSKILHRLLRLSKKPVTVKIGITRAYLHRYRIKVSFYVILSKREGSSHFGREKILRHCVPQNDI